MKKRILKNLHEYKPNLRKAIGKSVCLSGEYNIYQGERLDEMSGILYGTLQDFCPNSITIGNFIDMHTFVDFREPDKAVRFLETLEGLRVRRSVRVELTDKLEAYVIEVEK